MATSDITNLRSTIVPKSDQLNADQLLDGDMTITVTDVRMGNDEQPVILHYKDDQGRPFKPGKTMRKLLIFAWGEDGREWIGKSMTLYNDHAVKFGGMVVGGIRISHLSNIEREISLSLNSTKGKKATHTILPLTVVTLDDVLKAIKAATGRNAMNAAKVMAMKLTSESDVQAASDAYAERAKELRGGVTSAQPPVEPQPAALSVGTKHLIDTMNSRMDIDALDADATLISELPEADREEATERYHQRREELLGA